MAPENVSTALYNYPTLTSRLGAFLEIDVSDIVENVASIEGHSNVFLHDH